MSDKKPVYIRCPRCELNFILKKDKFCSVCKKEMQANGNKGFDDLDLELCPVCKTNYIQPDEIMCATCMKEHATVPEQVGEDDEWDAYISRDEDELVMPDEETGDMTTVNDIDSSDLLDSDLDDDLTFDEDEEEKDKDEEDEDEEIEDDEDDLEFDDEEFDDEDDDE